MGDVQKRGDTNVETYQNDPYVPQDTVSLLDIISVLARRWKLIFFATFLAGVGIVAFSLYTIRMPPDSAFNPLPNFYRPEVEVLILEQSDGVQGLLGSASGELGALANLVGISGGGGGSNSALAQRLLEQNTIIDQVIEEFGILEKHDFPENPRTSARNMIREPLETEFDGATGIMTIAYPHTDPVFATTIVNRVVELLENRFRELTMNQLSTRKEFLEEQIRRTETELDAATAELISYQRRFGITNLEAQAEQTIQQIGSLSAQVYEKELELAALLEYYPIDHPEVQRAENEIGHLRSLISELRGGFNEFSAIGIPQSQIGSVGVEYAELEAEVQIQRSILASLRARFETTRLEEADNSRMFQIIEPAEVPEVKAGPSRAMIVIVVTVTAFFLSVFLAFILEYFEKARRDPVEAEKLEEIKDAFRSRSRRKAVPPAAGERSERDRGLQET